GRGLAQPGIKVRGREYLRIIYGADYTQPENLERLRKRGLGHKRSLALREYALGLEALERAARGEPLWRVHEPVFALLALESEPIDPRLYAAARGALGAARVAGGCQNLRRRDVGWAGRRGMGWVDVDETYQVSLAGGKVVCRTAAGKVLKSVPAALKE